MERFTWLERVFRTPDAMAGTLRLVLASPCASSMIRVMREASPEPIRLLPPYGRSNFQDLRCEPLAYVDKTHHLRLLERYPNPYQLFLRPRRFGKSLWLSTLRCHYDLLLEAQWEQLFEGLAAEREPSSLRSACRVLEFDFSGVAADCVADARAGMRNKVVASTLNFCEDYGIGTEEQRQQLVARSTAAEVLGEALRLARRGPPVFVLIDEYDHFTNQLLTHDRRDFLTAVEQGGFVRTFYEVLKEGTKSCVKRIFLTGVTPVTLDALTSGFNIAANLSLLPQLHDLLGFTAAEVEQLLGVTLGLDRGEPSRPVLEELTAWYDGYAFVPGAERLFNPNMVLYYLAERLTRGAAPPSMLDLNLATDQGAMARLLALGDRTANGLLLEEVLEQGQTAVALTRQYALQLDLGPHDFGSLLFYLGLLTCRGQVGDRYLLGIPNRVIGELHWRMLLTILLERVGLDPGPTALAIADAVHALGWQADPGPLLEQVSLLLQQRISNRDLVRFDERHLKMIVLAFLSTTELYLVQSEPEVERGYVDLLLTRRPAIPVDWEHAFELKYLKTVASDAEVAEQAARAEQQLRTYLTARPLSERTRLAGWVVVFRGARCEVLRRV